MSSLRKTHPQAHLLATLLPLAFCFLVLAGALAPRKSKDGFDYKAFGELPVLLNGRTKPLDTVGRTSLLIIQEKQSLRLPKEMAEAEGHKKLGPTEWLTEVMFAPEKADARPLFLVHNPDVLGLLGYEQGTIKRLSFNQLTPKLEEIDKQAEQAAQVKEAQQRTLFQKAILELRSHLSLYHQLRNGIQPQGMENLAASLAELAPMRETGIRDSQEQAVGAAALSPEFTKFLTHAQPFVFQAQNAHFFAIPPLFPNGSTDEWQKLGDAVLKLNPSLRADQYAPGVNEYGQMASAYRAGNSERFNMALGDYYRWLEQTHPQLMKKSVAESFFNAFSPFYQCMVIYVAAGMLALISWLIWPVNVGRSAYVLLLVGAGIHTLGILFRMMLEGRPPVTNLYSSAVFIGWAAVILGIVLESLFRQGIGSFVGACVGFATLLIAHHLSLGGDTLEMMRAVLDSNFWLATHVVVITLGYAATFLAGILAIVYIIGGVLTTGITKEIGSAINRMVYGIVCFAALFSLVGTILGGIWADQSWGRFWGWDPKENGALLIVLWNAVILHARWGGIARERGIMQMAVFGNIVTSWSWFGTNMLGVGLHSYGFTDAAFNALAIFVGSQLAIIGLAGLPLSMWRSFRNRAPRAEAAGTGGLEAAV